MLSQTQVTESTKMLHLFYTLSSNNGFKRLHNSTVDSEQIDIEMAAIGTTLSLTIADGIVGVAPGTVVHS